MFCPDCGTENLRSQKFCTRCGTNLMAIDRAREIISEATTGAPSNPVDSSMLLKIVALVSIFGFLFVTAAVIVLAALQYGGPHSPNEPPVSFFVGLVGYAAIVLICWQLLKLIGASQKSESKRLASLSPAYTAPPAVTGSTNRALGEGATPYQSVTEQSTKQFEAQRPRANQ